MKKDVFDNIRIVLVEPQVPGNIGAAARAMKNMGLNQLVIVNPWFRDHPQARYMAHNSEDILSDARYFCSVAEAVADSVLVVGTTRRRRHNTPFYGPEESAGHILDSARTGPVSILFGREDKGLTNDELKCCQVLVKIPSSQRQPSLNLSQAVMVMSYVIYSRDQIPRSPALDLAGAADLASMFDHLERSLTLLGLRQWNDGDNYMKSLRRVFSRTRLERRDAAAIHKLCGEIDKYAARVRSELEIEYSEKEK